MLWNVRDTNFLLDQIYQRWFTQKNLLEALPAGCHIPSLLSWCHMHCKRRILLTHDLLRLLFLLQVGGPRTHQSWGSHCLRRRRGRRCPRNYGHARFLASAYQYHGASNHGASSSNHYLKLSEINWVSVKLPLRQFCLFYFDSGNFCLFVNIKDNLCNSK